MSEVAIAERNTVAQVQQSMGDAEIMPLQYHATQNIISNVSGKTVEVPGSASYHDALIRKTGDRRLSVNAPLPRFLVERIQREVILELRKPLRLYNLLKRKGLVVPYGNLGTHTTSWDVEGFMRPASRVMDPQVEVNNDALDYKSQQAPIPVTKYDFQIGIRKLEASRNAAALRGEAYPIDLAQIRSASRAVGESIENMLIFGAPEIVFEGNTVHGFLTFPDRETFTTTDWTSATTAEILADVRAMRQILLTNNVYPDDEDTYGSTGGTGYTLIYSLDYADPLDKPQGIINNVGYATVLEYIKKIAGIQETMMIPFLPAKTAILMKPDRSTMDIATALPVGTYQWMNNPVTRNYLVMGALAPRFKKDYEGQVGYVVGQP